MLKPIRVSFVAIICLCCSLMTNAYDRNQAMPVEKVIYGQVDSARHLTERQLLDDQHHGWRTFGGAVLGGVIGHQFGDGSGQDVATVLGALLGANVANRQNRTKIYRELRLVELMIQLEDGQQIMVLQDYDPAMLFGSGDEVRVIYFSDRVRVDRAL